MFLRLIFCTKLYIIIYTHYTIVKIICNQLKMNSSNGVSMAVIDEHKKTIEFLLKELRSNGIYKLSKKDIDRFASILNLNPNFLWESYIHIQPDSKNYKTKSDIEFICDILKITKEEFIKNNNNVEIISEPKSVNSNYLLDNIYRYILINDELKTLKSVDQKYDNINLIIQIIDNVTHHLSMILTQIATFQFFEDDYSPDFILFEKSNPWVAYRKILRNYTSLYFYNIYKDHLPVFLSLFTHEITVCLNTSLFINTLQIISSSPFYSPKTKEIAKTLLLDAFFIFKNAGMINYYINTLYHDISIKPQQRTKKDNTTFIQFNYVYQNSDAYSLRIDFPHKGVNCFHYNNVSPGGIKSYLFSRQEYFAIIKQHPQTVDFFIEYESIYALKERINCSFDDSTIKIYEQLCKEKDHKQIFNEDIKENDFINFAEAIKLLTPNKMLCPVSTSFEHQEKIFNYCKIMGINGLLGIFLSLRDKQTTEKLITQIVTNAIRYGIISNNEADEYHSLEGVAFISELAKENIANIK